MARTSWPAEQFEEGTFDWRPVAFRVAVPHDAQKISLVLGLGTRHRQGVVR